MTTRLPWQLKAPKTPRPALTPVRSGLLRRKCACGERSSVRDECECKKKRIASQAASLRSQLKLAVQPQDEFEQEADRGADAVTSDSVPSISKLGPADSSEQTPSDFALLIVSDVLQSNGQPLDPGTRARMMQRFGHDFASVRVHTDSKAAESARAMNALAYTVGSEVVFGEAQYAPHSREGQRLLAHELAHTVQQCGQKDLPATTMSHASAEQEAAAASAMAQGGVFRPTHRTPLQIARKGQDATTQTASATAAAPQPMTRAEFDKIMKNRYRVATIKKGTFQDQSFGDMKESEWKDWDPGSSSTVYEWIVEAFGNFEKTFGGLPPVKEIVFFDVEYHRDDQGKAVKFTDIGASYALGQLTIYKTVEHSNKMFNLQGTLESPTAEEAIKRNITHELGHGIAETALTQGTDKPPGADPDLFKDFRRAVGWTDDEKLYDIQEVAVTDAFKNKTSPPAQYQIKPDNVATRPWKERPLTSYMADNAGDDFAEAIMAFVNEPQRLKALSPTRYDFIDKRKGRWIASGQLKVNIWEQVKRGGPARTLEPSRPRTIWERALEAK